MSETLCHNQMQSSSGSSERSDEIKSKRDVKLVPRLFQKRLSIFFYQTVLAPHYLRYLRGSLIFLPSGDRNLRYYRVEIAFDGKNEYVEYIDTEADSDSSMVLGSLFSILSFSEGRSQSSTMLWKIYL